MFGSLFGKKPRWGTQAHALYSAAIAQSRQPGFYTLGGVADSVDGRFDLLTLHVVLILRRLKGEGDDAAALSQALFDLMFADMDQNLREMGVSDVAVSNKVKKMLSAFYGRLNAYDAALTDGDEALADALGRNLYRGTLPDLAVLAQMVGYVRQAVAALAALPLAGLLQGQLSFGKGLGA